MTSVSIENAPRQPDYPHDQDDSFRVMVPGSESFMSICYTSSRNGLLATSGDPGWATKVHGIEPATQPAPSSWIFGTGKILALQCKIAAGSFCNQSLLLLYVSSPYFA